MIVGLSVCLSSRLPVCLYFCPPACPCICDTGCPHVHLCVEGGMKAQMETRR